MRIRKADLGKPDIEARTVPVVLSTDFPVERSGYIEILDVSKVDLSRGDLPLIESHDSQKLNIGVVRNIRPDGAMLRGQAVFGMSARASEVLADVQAGIVTGVSIGYLLTDEGEPINLPDGRAARKFGFMPYEVSAVAIPADPRSGFNRSHPLKSQDNHIMETAPNPNAAAASSSAAEILALGEAHAKRGGVDLALKFIRERRGLQEFRAALLDTPEMQTRETDMFRPSDFSLATPGAPGGTGYSLLRAVDAAITGDWRQAGLERELSQEMARAYGRKPRGIFVPFGAMTNTRVMSSSGATTGQALIPTTHQGFVEMLRNSARVLEAGATVMSGLVGNIDIPRQTAGAAAEWLGEDDAITPSDMNFNSVSLTPKTVGALLSWTRRMSLSALPEMEGLARADLAKQIGLALDRAALHGVGSSNQPAGIYAATNVNSVAMGGVPTFGKLIDMASALGSDNALQGNLAFLTTPGMAGKLAQTVVVASTDTRMIWDGSMVEGKLIGINAYSTGQVSATLGAGSEHGLILGDFSQMIIGIWGGGVDVLVDPYTDADRGRVRISAFMDLDIAFRHPEAFCKATGATIA
jgi:HK97 family phage major capsid protein